jgi:hypothetical protein
LEAVEWFAKLYGIAIESEDSLSPGNYSKNKLLDIQEDDAMDYQKKFQKMRQFNATGPKLVTFP